MPASTRSSAAGPGLGGSSGSRSSGASSRATSIETIDTGNREFDVKMKVLKIWVRAALQALGENHRELYVNFEYYVDLELDYDIGEYQEQLKDTNKHCMKWFMNRMCHREYGDRNSPLKFSYEEAAQDFLGILCGVLKAYAKRQMRGGSTMTTCYEQEDITPPYEPHISIDEAQRLVQWFSAGDTDVGMDVEVEIVEQFREQEEGEDDDDYYNDRDEFEEGADYNYTLLVSIYKPGRANSRSTASSPASSASSRSSASS